MSSAETCLSKEKTNYRRCVKIPLCNSLILLLLLKGHFNRNKKAL